MSTKRETILAAAAASLADIPGVPDASVYRSRHVALARSETPAIMIEPVNDTPDNPNIHRLEWQMLLRAAVLIRSDLPDVSSDVIVAAVHSRIMTDPIIQSLVSNIVPGATDWQFFDSDKPLCIVSMQFRLSYSTDLDTLY